MRACYECPNCDSKLQLPRLPDKPVLHPCRGLKGLIAPMILEGVKAKVEAREREDYVKQDIPHYDGEGKAIMSIVTTRDDGTDARVLVPTAVIGDFR